MGYLLFLFIIVLFIHISITIIDEIN